MDKNSLIKYLVKEISQELKKEIKSIIKEEFNNLNNRTTNKVVETTYAREQRPIKSNSSLDSLLSSNPRSINAFSLSNNRVNISFCLFIKSGFG